MNRTDRLTAILIHLQTKRVVRAQEIADRFGISLRTVYRDIRALEEAGVPIGAEAGIGYFLEDYHLPPVHLTRTEASALLFGAKLIEKLTDESVQTEFESALFKIKSVLKRGDKEHLEDLEPQVGVSRPRTVRTFSTAFLNDIQQAVAQNRVLQIEYLSIYNGQSTQREIEPVGLYYYGSAWHLIAFCRTRHDYRDFRIDRIKVLTNTGRTFVRHERLSLEAYLARERTREDMPTTDVTIRVKNNEARFMQEQRCTFGFVAEEDACDSVRMHFRTPFTEGLSRWLLSYGNAVTIESPESFLHLMQERAEEVRTHYLEGVVERLND
ncbi:helix-turn-helix transcriptional regulator [Tellurirhabdus rosea]|uniref:helix-turn-helix transcriptional regulator n=1 Tax=Tellurirhabdus rosea TaxID=2674997 RepID=UPI00224E342D|nr:YafY family protein [Tellurirhabdus rosea]